MWEASWPDHSLAIAVLLTLVVHADRCLCLLKKLKPMKEQQFESCNPYDPHVGFGLHFWAGFRIM